MTIVNGSNVKLVYQYALKYGYDPSKIKKSKVKGKKWAIETPDGKIVNFGALGMDDYTVHRDEVRRESYDKRSKNIKGDWKNNKYSPNNLSRRILWDLS
jgi:uncharacterized radical SAM superfamily Fe-S cluster-containing enzyme